MGVALRGRSVKGEWWKQAGRTIVRPACFSCPPTGKTLGAWSTFPARPIIAGPAGPYDRWTSEKTSTRKTCSRSTTFGSSARRRL